MPILLFVLVVDVVGCPLHLGLKAVWFATTHAGWSRLHDWHGCRDGGVTRLCWRYLLLPQHVGSFFLLFVCLFSRTFTITIITFFMITMSGCFLISGCVLWKGSCLTSKLFFSLKYMLAGFVRGYCMLHGWIMGLVLVVHHSFC